MTFNEELEIKVKYIESVIEKYLPEEKGYAKTVIEAMNYSIRSGGKRIRPLLMFEAYRLFGGEDDIIEPFMAAIEMIHTYSLVHDDLPCMDNDEYRRGRKTTHAVYGEAMGVLAGDGLLNYAFETACKAFDKLNVIAGADYNAMTIARAISILASKSGIYGMIGGQCADIEAEDIEADQITDKLIRYIHEHKTAALIENALMIGAVLAGANEIN
ncbi:MAG: polyprenyl synthetase family protein, partial [Lachnospiraceae bacterium]|nr:polyprenyl synthetase family protein [Lachnospiraceae bacterium]